MAFCGKMKCRSYGDFYDRKKHGNKMSRLGGGKRLAEKTGGKVMSCKNFKIKAIVYRVYIVLGFPDVS